MLAIKEQSQVNDLNSYYQVPRWTVGLRRSMSKASVDIQDYIFYQFSNEWSKDYGVFFISRLAKDLDYSENTVRKALKECFDKKIFLVHDMKIEGKLILKNTLENQMLLTEILEGKKSIEVDLKSSIKITDKKSILPFKKSNIFTLKNEGIPFKNNEVPPFKNEGVSPSTVEGKQTQSEGLKPIQSIENKETQDTDRKYYVIENNIYIEKDNEVKKEVQQPKQISELTPKQKIYFSYKNLRKNDPEYLELLKQVCTETSEEVLKEWLEARPFIQTQGNIPYYILNSIQNKRSLPEAYLIQKIEKTRKDLFDKWSNPYQEILKEKLNFSRIDDSLANLLNQTLIALEQVKTYHNSKLIEFKANETNQKMLELNTKFLQNLINNSSIEMIQELFSKFFHSQNLKNKCRYFRSLKDDSYQSLLNSIQMINHYVSKGF